MSRERQKINFCILSIGFEHATNVYFVDQGSFQICCHQSCLQTPQIPVLEVMRSYSEVTFHLIPTGGTSR